MTRTLASAHTALPVAGVELSACTAGLKASGRPDLALVHLAPGSRTAAMFTRNAFCAAPVHVARDHLAATAPRILLINAGCANAGTGREGEVDARRSCDHVAAATGVAASEVLPFSTGVIGKRLDLERLFRGVDDCVAAGFSPTGWEAAATAMMTTDTRAKVASRRVALSGGAVTITGMAKGAGMIRPDMATMLAFVATDADVPADELDGLLRAAVDVSLHCITVDGDTSTNDAVTLSATGASGVTVTTDADRTALADALAAVFIELAQAIVADAEGATRLIEIQVQGGGDVAECREVAFTVAHSPLVKTAVFGGDPNWGRILAAVGRAPINALEVAGVDIALGAIPLVRQGEPVAGYDEAAAASEMRAETVRITIGLGRGTAETRVWTSDLSHDYVRINADYRT